MVKKFKGPIHFQFFSTYYFQNALSLFPASNHINMMFDTFYPELLGFTNKYDRKTT